MKRERERSDRIIHVNRSAVLVQFRRSFVPFPLMDERERVHSST
jgi:hypothetical protein